MFVTLTSPSYGRVLEDGTPADPAAYDYTRAARDALHFAALFDRFIQNLRRYLGHDVQYFAAIEPQRRLAPHVHIAMRGTLARTELRQVIAATYPTVKARSTSFPTAGGAAQSSWATATASLTVSTSPGARGPRWRQRSAVSWKPSAGGSSRRRTA